MYYYQILILVIFYYVLRFLLFIIIYTLDPNKDLESDYDYQVPGSFYYFMCHIDDALWIVYWIWSIRIVYKLRTYIRSYSKIPDTGICCSYCTTCGNNNICNGEDTMYSILCPGLAIYQLLRLMTHIGQ